MISPFIYMLAARKGELYQEDVQRACVVVEVILALVTILLSMALDNTVATTLLNLILVAAATGFEIYQFLKEKSVLTAQVVITGLQVILIVALVRGWPVVPAVIMLGLLTFFGMTAERFFDDEN